MIRKEEKETINDSHKKSETIKKYTTPSIVKIAIAKGTLGTSGPALDDETLSSPS